MSYAPIAADPAVGDRSINPPPLATSAPQAAVQPAANPAPAGFAGLYQPAADASPGTERCRCGHPMAFHDSSCPVCRTPLGYDSQARKLFALDPVLDDSQEPVARAAVRYRRCARVDSAAACNWLVAEADVRPGEPPLCRCCRLTRVLPDLSQPAVATWWHDIEEAKRRLVSTLIGLQLPVPGRDEDAELGLAFDLLQAQPGAPPVCSGQVNGVITVDVEAADDAWRRQLRLTQALPYRSLLADLRHDSAGAYWQRLVDNGPWLKPCRELFGDERLDHTLAMRLHARHGAPAHWNNRFISSHASSHPAEDWAETWAAYLHIVDTLETAQGFGLDCDRFAACIDPVGEAAVSWSYGPQAEDFLRLINQWLGLRHVFDAMWRNMGVADIGPGVLSLPVLRKLFLVHCVIAAARGH